MEIIYEDDDVLAINKPSGLVVHSDGRTEERTLADWVLENRPLMRDVGEPLVLHGGKEVQRPGVVHRLDRETSGVIVLAKNADSFSFFKEQFQNRSVKKRYSAFVYGKLKEKKGTITLPIGKSCSDFRLFSAEYGARGEMREAVTEYEMLEEGKQASFLDVFPKTGRTHQIRVHFKALGHPIVCDSRYATKRPCILGFKRLALHAHSIAIKTPSGVLVTLEAPLPEEFVNGLKELRGE